MTRRATVRTRLFGGLGILLVFAAGAESRTPVPALAPSGLRAQWTFAEGSGATVGDSSGNGFTGTLTNGPTWTAGRIGTGVNLNGVNQYVNLGSNLAILNSASAATVSIWIKPGSTIPSGTFRELVSLSVGSSNPTDTSRVALALQGNGAGGQVFLGGRSTDTEAQKNVVTTGSVVVGTWTHLAGVIDFQNNTLKIYVNGIQTASATAVGFASATTPNTPCRSCALGSEDSGDTGFFQGALDEVQVYNRVLSAAEISTLAFGDALAARWSFDEGSGTTAGDSTGNGYNGTLKNGASWVIPGQIGNAISLNGVNQYIDIGANLNVLRNVNAGTATAWIKPSSVIPAGAYQELVSISVNAGSPTNTSRLALSLKGDGTTGGRLYAGGRSTDTEPQKFLVASSGLTVGVWSHVAASIDFAGKSITLYVNGAPVGTAVADFSQSHTPNTPSTNAALASQDTGDSNFYAGNLDEVRVYGRALSRCDIETLALHDALHAWWRFDESSGTATADATGNGFTGTLTNGATFVPGQFGNAVSLNGINQNVNIGTNLALLNGVRAATVATWVKLTSVPASGTYRDLISISVNNGTTPTDTSRIALSLKGNTSTADIFAGARSTDTETQQSVTGIGSLGTGTWYHVAAVIDYGGNTIKVYKNGTLLATQAVVFSQPVTPSTNSTNVALGSQDSGDGNFFAGLLDETRVYCRALADSEILSLATPALPSAPTNLVATAGDTRVTLTWTASSGATSYNVYQRLDGGIYSLTPIANTTTTAFTVMGLVNGQKYWFKVTGVNSPGEGPASTEVSATPQSAGQVPAKPIILTPSQTTNNSSPLIVGTADPNVTITLFFNGTPETITTISDFQGNWSLVPSAKTDNTYGVTATASNSVGVSPASDAISITIDTLAPVVSNPSPANQSTILTMEPNISATWSDLHLDLSTAVIRLDGNVVTPQTISTTGFTFVPSPPLSLGTHSVSVQVNDLAGNASNTLTWSFTVAAPPVDTIPPVISNLVPANGGFTNNPRPLLTASISDAGGSGVRTSSVTLSVNSIVVAATVTLADANHASVSFTPTSDLGEGPNTFLVNAADNAGNSATGVSSTFTVDRTPPVVLVGAPLPQSTSSSLSVPLSATVTDGVGILAGSVAVILNSVDVTPQMTVSVTSTNALGHATAVQVTGVLAANLGTNSLSLVADDLALNLTQTNVSFIGSTGTSLPPPPPSFNLSIVSGDGQSGTINRSPSNPLVVQVTDSTTGNPASGISVIYRVTGGGGLVVTPPNPTDTSGQTNAQLRLGPRQGANTVQVNVTGFPDGPSVTFTVQGQPPTISATAPQWEEYSSSAMPGTMRVLVNDAAGNAMAGVEVVPEVFPPNSSFGEFHPFRGVTDANGSVRFAFSISPNAPVAPFNVRVDLPDFLDTTGAPIVSNVLPANVRDPSNRPFQIKMGQGQLVLPGQTTSSKLVVDLVFPPDVPPPKPTDQFTFLIEILEGTGFLIQGESPNDGTLTPMNATQSLAKTAPGSLEFRFRYQKGSENQPDLVRVQGTDIFVIGIPQSCIVDMSGNVIRDPHASSPVSFSTPDLVKVRVLTQLGSATPSISLKSQDSLFHDRMDQSGVAPQALNLNVTGVTSAAPLQYSTFESDAFQITSEIFQDGAATSGTPILHVFGGEGLSWKPTSGGFDIPISPVTVTGAYPSANFIALGDFADNVVVLFGTARGFGGPSGRTLEFLLNDQSVGTATTNDNGEASLTVTLIDQLYKLVVRDSATQAVSFTMLHLRGVRFPFETEEAQDATGVAIGPESLAAWKTILDQSATGQHAELFIPNATILMKTEADMKAIIKARLIQGGMGDTLADVTAGQKAAKFNAETGLEVANGAVSISVMIKLKSKPVQTAVTLAHELRHVEDDVTASNGLKGIAAKLVGPKGYTGDALLHVIAGKVFHDDYGRRADATAEANNLEAWKNFYAVAVEGPGWLQGANTVKELKAKSVQVGDVYSDMFDISGNVLADQAFITAVRGHSDADAIAGRTKDLLDSGEESLAAYNADADLKAAVDDFVTKFAAPGKPFRSTLVNLARSRNLLPRSR